jgi:glucose dehydrogenase
MKNIWLCAMLLGLWAAPGWAQTTDELVNDGKNTENVTTQSMGYDRKSYSPLKQIDKSNIKRLVPIWNTSLMNDQGELAAPTIYNGVMYVINGKWTFAIDVETGRQIWRTPVQYEDRQRAVEPEIRRLTRGLLRHGWTDHRQRRVDFRCGWWRVDHARVPRRLGS